MVCNFPQKGCGTQTTNGMPREELLHGNSFQDRWSESLHVKYSVSYDFHSTTLCPCVIDGEFAEGLMAWQTL